MLFPIIISYTMAINNYKHKLFLNVKLYMRKKI